jgi:hypothetical protein
LEELPTGIALSGLRHNAQCTVAAHLNSVATRLAETKNRAEWPGNPGAAKALEPALAAGLPAIAIVPSHDWAIIKPAANCGGGRDG